MYSAFVGIFPIIGLGDTMILPSPKACLSGRQGEGERNATGERNVTRVRCDDVVKQQYSTIISK